MLRVKVKQSRLAEGFVRLQNLQSLGLVSYFVCQLLHKRRGTRLLLLHLNRVVHRGTFDLGFIGNFHHDGRSSRAEANLQRVGTGTCRLSDTPALFGGSLRLRKRLC